MTNHQRGDVVLIPFPFTDLGNRQEISRNKSCETLPIPSRKPQI